MVASFDSSSGFARINAPIFPSRASVPRLPPSGMTLGVIIFTEYDDTKRYLHQQLQAAIEGTDRADERIAIFHGPTPSEEREAIKQAFNAEPSKHPVRILIATDAAREGLNLQATLLEPVPLRCSVESQPHGTAKRPHRPQAPTE